MRGNDPAHGGAPDAARFPELVPMWIGLFVDVLGYSILIPLFPFISKTFPGANALVVSLLLSTNAVFGFVFGPLIGSLSDKHGRKPLLVLSLIGTTVSFLLFALARDLVLLFVSRAVDGIFGGVYPITRAVIGDIVPIKHRAKEMANMGVVHILASLAGPAVSGVLAERTGSILAPGLLATFMALGSLAIAVIFFKETLPSKTGTYQGRPVGVGAGDGAGAVVHPPGTASAVQGPPTPPAGDLPVSKNKVALYMLAQWGFHALYFTIFITMGSLYLSEHLGLNVEQIGYLMLLSGVFRIIVRFVAFDPVLRKIGDRHTATLGLLLFVVAFGILVFVQEWIMYLVVLVLTSFAATCARGTMNSFLSRSVSRFKQGRIQGLANSLEKVAEIAGPATGGVILATGGGPGFAALLLAVSCVPLAMATRRLEFPGDVLSPGPARPGPPAGPA